jgi:phosphatidylserine/phosphatidylglycerophosphate/cardiolipin synthase-like enzyme
MRTSSKKTEGYVIFAVSGTNTISFAIDFREADTTGLLGFAIKRFNKTSGDNKEMEGYKVFESNNPNPDIDTVVNTFTQPIQSFVWDDFACYDDNEYEYLFYPIKGSPGNLDRSSKPISISIKTEKLFSDNEHDIFFNRGVASSQAYRRKFLNLPPDKILDPIKKQEALAWLSRQLDDAIFKFIANAQQGETLLGCFYEFHYNPVIQAFKDAIGRGVNVKIIIDAKNNKSVDKEGKIHESFPREANLQAITDLGIPSSEEEGIIIKREAKKNDIQHNKFIVLVDKNNNPKEVWTGSTNISLGGIHGQTNVGHWVRNTAVANKFKNYWELLSTDPGGKEGDDKNMVKQKNKELKKNVEDLQQNIVLNDWNDIPTGITPIFSPRSGTAVLETYVKMFDRAETVSCVTLAFGINKLFKDYLEDNTDANHISFMLLEKEDKPDSRSKLPYRRIGAKENVYIAWGAQIEDELYRWTKETSALYMGLNTHVIYIHSKFMLIDPLGKDPIVVTGSANFSESSTNDNDENMMIIRGDPRVADIYFTEFNRLFNHYYFRSIYKQIKRKNNIDKNSLFLSPDDSWLKKYEPGKLRYKRVEMFIKMEGYETI